MLLHQSSQLPHLVARGCIQSGSDSVPVVLLLYDVDVLFQFPQLPDHLQLCNKNVPQYNTPEHSIYCTVLVGTGFIY